MKNAFVRRHNKHPMDFSWHFGVLMALNQMARKGVTAIGEVWLTQSNKGKLDVWNTEDFFFAYLDTKTKVNKKWQQPNPSRVIKSSDPSEMKAKVTPPDKEPRFTETPDGSRGNAERVEEGDYKYQFKIMWSVAERRVIIDMTVSVLFVKNILVHILNRNLWPFFYLSLNRMSYYVTLRSY